MLSEFKAFIAKGNVIDLAVGVLTLVVQCFATGRLTAVRLVPGQPPVILQVTGTAS